jgi:hypothetical protein
MKQVSPIRANRNNANKKVKKFGDLRYDYIKFCTHELTNNRIKGTEVYVNSCPLCKLVQAATKSFFIAEAEQRLINKENSQINRAIMRINLLNSWSKCQSILYSDLFPTDNIDIFLSKSLVSSFLPFSLLLLNN